MKRLFTLLCLSFVFVNSFSQTIREFIEASPEHTVLDSLLRMYNLHPILEETDSLTLFAPTDGAFSIFFNSLWDPLREKLILGGLDFPGIPEDSILKATLLYHIVGGVYFSDSLSNFQQLPTKLLDPETSRYDQLRVFLMDETITVDSIPLSTVDQEVENGMIQVVDGVIIPPRFKWVNPLVVEGSIDFILRSFPNFEDFRQAMWHTGEIINQDKGYTVFAPVNSAFSSLKENDWEELLDKKSWKYKSLIEHHKIRHGVHIYTSDSLYDGRVFTSEAGNQLEITRTDSGIFVQNARIIFSDIISQYGFGVIHIIDTLLLPWEVDSSINDYIFQNPDLSEWSQYTIRMSQRILREKGPYTLFAPLNSAIDSLRKESAISIQKLAAISPDKAELLIDTHILTEDLSLDSLVSRGIVPTLSGEELAVQQIGEEVYIGKARVVEGDIKVDNGVIHVLDSVLVPNFVYNFLTENQPQLASSVGIEVYPNPVYEQMTLSYPAPMVGKGRVSLMDPLGKIVQSWDMSLQNETISVGHFSPGTYLLVFDVDEVLYSQLIMKK